MAPPQYVIHHDCMPPGVTPLEIFHLLFWKIAFPSLSGVTEETNSWKAFLPELGMIHQKESDDRMTVSFRSFSERTPKESMYQFKKNQLNANQLP